MTPGLWPDKWIGTWAADDGKTVVIERTAVGVVVTVAPTTGQRPYESAELLGGGTEQIERLVGHCLLNAEGRRYLEIEAGTPELGPTYRLYAAVEDDSGRRAASDETPVEAVVLVPNTSIGLYDDFDEDQGVPWAYPLNPMRWRGHT